MGHARQDYARPFGTDKTQQWKPCVTNARCVNAMDDDVSRRWFSARCVGAHKGEMNLESFWIEMTRKKRNDVFRAATAEMGDGQQ